MGSVGTSACKEVSQPIPVVCVEVCLLIFHMGSVLSPESKALFLSTEAESVRCTDFGAFCPSCICFVSVVRNVEVEYLALKPY